MREYLEVHRAAVRGLAARDYAPAVINAWAPVPITHETVEAALTNPDGEVRLKAMVGHSIVGVGAVVPHLRELRACYVLPERIRLGIGRAIVVELERIARAEAAPFLTVVSSLTALTFYQSLSFEIIDRSDHLLSSGVRMAAVTLRKRL